MSDWVLSLDLPGAEQSDIRLSSRADLDAALQQLLKRGEGTALVAIRDGRKPIDYLYVGIERQDAFAHYCPLRSGGSALWACREPADQDAPTVCFDMGGTGTDIPAKCCIPISEMVHIAHHFYENNELSAASDWEKEEDLF